MSLSPYVTGNHDYTSSISAMLRDLEWPTLQQRRHLSRLTVFYKIYNHLVDTDFTSQLTLRQSSTRGHASRFLVSLVSRTLPNTKIKINLD